MPIRGEEGRTAGGLKHPPLLVRHAPDGIGSVICYVERAVAAYRDAYWAAPNFAVLRYEAGQEIVVLAGGFAVWRWDHDHFIAGALRAIPGTVLGREDISAEFIRELRGFVEGETE